MKKKSFAAQFRYTFLKIIAASIVISILTIILFAILAVSSLDRDIYPADYYERQIPGIVSYVQEKNMALLSPDSQKDLEAVIESDGILYQIINAEGEVIYGTLMENPYASKEELFTKFINEKQLCNGYYIQTVPIMQDGDTQGAALFAYTIKTTFVNFRGRIIFTLFIISLFSPFIYVIIFTLWLSKKFEKEINQPLQLLADASKKIKEKNLDFTIDYHADNELGKLCTAFSEMQEELKRSLTAQWKMEQERVEMMAALAHDLKSPLSIILAYSDALVEDNQEGNEELKKYLAVIQENAGKSASLIKQMQYTSELENREMKLNTTTINIREFMEQKVQSYQLKAQQKSIVLVLSVDENVPDYVEIDPEFLARILDNLLSNSLQYTHSDGRVEVRVNVESGQLCYIVSDTGCGFSKKDLKRAFDKFYRGDEARQTNGEHSGLGLYIVKQLVEQLNGSIQIGNSPTGGACVIFQHKLIS